MLIEFQETRIHTTIDEALSRWIMNISGDNINNPNDGETEIDISKDLLITESKDPIKTLLKEVYGEYFAKSYNPDFCHDSAILCHRDDDVDQINDYMLSLLPGNTFIAFLFYTYIYILFMHILTTTSLYHIR